MDSIKDARSAPGLPGMHPLNDGIHVCFMGWDWHIFCYLFVENQIFQDTQGKTGG